MKKKCLIIVILIFIVCGCTDPFTEHNKDVIKTINNANDIMKKENARNYINSVIAQYTNYMAENNNYPSIEDINVVSETTACNSDPTSPEYALKNENGYLHIYCGEYGSHTIDDMKLK